MVDVHDVLREVDLDGPVLRIAAILAHLDASFVLRRPLRDPACSVDVRILASVALCIGCWSGLARRSTPRRRFGAWVGRSATLDRWPVHPWVEALRSRNSAVAWFRDVPDIVHAARPIRAGTAAGPVLSGPSPSPPEARTFPVSSGWLSSRSPSASMFFAAFTSRSCCLPQASHCHCRSASARARWRWPQALQRLLEGNQRSTAITLRPYHFALYSSWRPSAAMGS